MAGVIARREIGDDLMQSSETYYLFPFGDVRARAKVLVYGAGRAGQMYMRQIMASHYCELVGMLDQRADEYQHLPCHVWFPNALQVMRQEDYDFVVISVQKTEVQIEIRKELCNIWDVPQDKIIISSKHNELSTDTLLPAKRRALIGVPAFERSEVPIAFIFRTGSGLGDAVIVLKLLEALLILAPEAVVDIYVEDEIQKSYVEIFYTEVHGFGSIQPLETYTFFRQKYALSINRNRFVDIDYLNEKLLYSKCPVLLTAMQKVKKFNELYFRPNESVNARNYALSHILGTDCYSCLGGGALPIKGNKVAIRLWPDYEEAFEQLGLRHYITFNCGSGGISGRRQIKEWPSDYMGRYLEIVKTHFPDFEIIQLGSKDMQPLQQANRHYLGIDLRLVEYILAHSLLHVDIEGGLVHLASQLGTKCAVIFGPTDPKHFGYQANINLISDVCVPCFGVRLDAYHCLRGEDERLPCMCAVRPEEVWERTRDWLESHEECLQ